MSGHDDREYYAMRAVMSHDMARRVSNPVIAAVHAELAIRYELLASQAERAPNERMSQVYAA